MINTAYVQIATPVREHACRFPQRVGNIATIKYPNVCLFQKRIIFFVLVLR